MKSAISPNPKDPKSVLLKIRDMPIRINLLFYGTTFEEATIFANQFLSKYEYGANG
jgi:hypothetical protein